MARLLNKYSQVIAGVGTAGLFGLTLVPQTLRLKTYKEVLGNYQGGEIQPVSKEVEDILEKVLYRMNLGAEEEAHLDLFTCCGNDPVHKGSLFFRTGSIIGIPPTFYYKSANDVEKSDLRAGRRIIDWESDAGKRLVSSIMLSEKAKAFAIAREINYAASYHIYVDGMLKALFIMMAYSSGFVMNHRLQLRERLKVWGRGGIYGTLGGVAYLMYTVIADAYYCSRDNSVDKKTAKLGWAYAEGGLEFYKKSLERNMALRELMGPEGANVYTVYGNDTSTVRRSYIQLTERKSALEKYFKVYQDKEMAKLEEEQVVENGTM